MKINIRGLLINLSSRRYEFCYLWTILQVRGASENYFSLLISYLFLFHISYRFAMDMRKEVLDITRGVILKSSKPRKAAGHQLMQ